VAETIGALSGEAVRALLWVIVLAAGAVFVAASVARAATYARLPMHLRWEVYPVAHEPRARARYGGSAFEETDWWTRPRETDALNAAGAMVREVLFLRGLWEANRPLWFRSYPFHLGLYLVVAATALLAAGAVGWIAAPGLAAPAIGPLSAAGEAIGTAGLALSVLGALALLHRRLTDRALAPYTTPGDLFNLAAFVIAFGCLLAGVLSAGPGAMGGVAVVRAIVTIDGAVPVAPAVAVGVALSALLAAYIPFTHMAHFIAKYFTYHQVRWDDEPNLGPGRIERSIARSLAERPTWGARHVGADGTRTWGEIATSAPAERQP
jgi:nitrate reductase gamma subunit